MAEVQGYLHNVRLLAVHPASMASSVPDQENFASFVR